MSKKFKEFRVFIASPGDLSPERKVFRDTIETMNNGYGEGARVKFIPYGWEDELSTTGLRVQSVINVEVDRCDFFVLVLHRRWGQKVSNSSYSSYTEEEFYTAYNRWEKTRKPAIVIFFKNIDAGSLADPGSELKKVLKFKDGLNKLNVLYRSFVTETDFGNQLEEHLRAFSEGRWDTLYDNISKIEISKKNIKSFEKTESDVNKKIIVQTKKGNKAAGAGVKIQPDTTLVDLEKESLTFTRAAITALDGGNTEDAKVLFAKATEGTTNLSILSIAIEFYNKIGDNENANQLVKRLSAITNDREIAARHLLSLYPPNFIRELQEPVYQQFSANSTAEQIAFLEEIKTVLERDGIWEKFLINISVKYYSTAEIMAQAQLLSTAEGQSLVYKQRFILIESMQFGNYAFMRVAAELTGEGFEYDVNSGYDQILGIAESQAKIG